MPAISLLGTDYATLNLWWAAEKDNDYLGVGPILEVPAGLVGAVLTADLQLRYLTASAATIRAVAGDECVGDVTTPSAIAMLDCGGFRLDYRCTDFEMQDIYVKNFEFRRTGDDVQRSGWRRCVVEGHIALAVRDNTDLLTDNTVFVLPAGNPYGTERVIDIRYATNIDLSSCTVINKGGGPSDGAIYNRSTLAINLDQTVVYSASNSSYAESLAPPAPTGGNNAASDAALPGVVTSNVASTVFLDFANGDYRIDGASAPAQQATPAGAFIQAVVNVDPALDTPIPDQVIGETAVSSYDTGAHFSDANVGDVLTYSITPDLNLVTGFTFSTVTGVITWDGTQVIAPSANYTVTATDGNGGVDASDLFTLVVITDPMEVTGITLLEGAPGTQVTVTIDAKVATATIASSAGSFAVDSQTATTVVFTVPDPVAHGDGSLLFNGQTVFTLDDGVSTVDFDFSITPTAEYLFGEITSVSPDGIYANDVGVIAGDYGYGTPTGDVAVNISTGDWTLGVGAASFAYYVYDQGDSQWYGPASATWEAGSADVTPPVLSLIGADPLSWVQGAVWVDPGAIATDNVDNVITVDADNIPDVNILAATTLNYNHTDASGNAAIQITRVVNVIAVDTEIPVITLNGAAVLNWNLSEAWVDPGAVVTDNFDPTVTIYSLDSVDVSIIGDTVITYAHTDVAGNVGTSVTRVVSVVDLNVDTLVQILERLDALEVKVDDVPTNLELADRTLPAADYFNAVEDSVVLAAVEHDGAVIPTVQEQIGRLSTGSAAISIAANGAVVTVGAEVLTYLVTANRDLSYYEISDIGGQIDFKYQFDVGSTGVGVSATLHGRLQGVNDSVNVFAYNWGEATWDQVGSFSGSNSTTDVEATVNILLAHTGVGVDAGKIELRAYQPSGLTSAVLYMDQIYVSYVMVSQFDHTVDEVITDSASRAASKAYVDDLATSAEVATVDTNVDALLVQLNGMGVERNQPFSNYPFEMVLASDSKSPAPGLTVTAQRSLDGGAYTNVTGTITEISNGSYQFDATAADTNGDTIIWKFSAATADDTKDTFLTV